MANIKLGGKYSHLECTLDDDWAQMFADAGVKIMFGSHGMGGYAFVRCKKFNGKQRADRVHSIIMDFIGNSKNLVVDHINGNKLDNRRSNLRIIKQSENCSNKNNKINSNNSTGIRGLAYSKRDNSYQIEMRANGKRLYRKEIKNKYDAILIAKFNNLIREL